MNDVRRFWMVKGNGPTSAEHYSREAAEDEAHRLALKHPGQRFVVLEAVGGCVAASWVTPLRIVNTPAPF